MSEEAKGGGNKGMMMIIMAMLGLIIVALVGVSIFLITSLGNDGNGDGDDGSFTLDQPVSPFDIVILDVAPNITTNLLPRADGRRAFVMLETVALGINNLDESEANDFMLGVSQRQPVVISTINDILRRWTPEPLETAGGVEVLRENILQALQDEFGHMIVSVLFTIIVQ